MLGFGIGGVVTGKIADRFGIVTAIGLGIGILALGYVGAGLSPRCGSSSWCISPSGSASSATFGPLMAEASHWFERYRGLAVTIAASGNYIGGTIWPPLVNWGMQSAGWRTTHIAVGIFTAVAMALALVVLRLLIGRRAAAQPCQRAAAAHRSAALHQCADGDAVARQHRLLRGDVDAAGSHRRLLRRSRLRRGARRRNAVADAGLRHHQPDRLGISRRPDRRHRARLLIGSVAQGFALLFYLFFDSLTSLYVISAMFGLFQGGIVPSYAIIVREAMPAREAATRVGIVIFASVFGMSFGGWVSGVIFDATGSYAAAFLNGLGWNALNVTIMVSLLIRRGAAAAGDGVRRRAYTAWPAFSRTQPLILRLPSGSCSSVYSASHASPLASMM